MGGGPEDGLLHRFAGGSIQLSPRLKGRENCWPAWARRDRIDRHNDLPTPVTMKKGRRASRTLTSPGHIKRPQDISGHYMPTLTRQCRRSGQDSPAICAGNPVRQKHSILLGG
jgi:hypothetical protein